MGALNFCQDLSVNSMNKPNLSVVYFGVREQDNGGTEHVVLEFDFKTFRLSKYIDSLLISSVSFGEIKAIHSDGEHVHVTFSNSNNRYTPFNMKELEDLCELFSTIIDNISEMIHPGDENIASCCTKLQPLVCMRKCLVAQKSYKRKGKRGGLSIFNRKNKPVPDVTHLVLTNKSLIYFESEKSTIPISIYPVSAIDIKKPSDSSGITISCAGDKGIFNPVQEGDEQFLFYNAWRAANSTDIKICHEIKSILDQLQELFEGTFDKTNDDHVALLQRLWDASNLGIPDNEGEEPIQFEVKANRWKDLGFQRDDPVSDLRATGLLGLQNLVYFAEQFPGLFLSMARNQQQSSEMEYPFATAGINITYLLITLLGLRNPQTWYPTVDTHPLFFFNIHAWEELYTIIFRLFDQKWNQMLVGYMGFQKVIDRTREDVGGMLRHKNPMSGDDNVPLIFEMLGILLNDLETFKTDSSRKQQLASHSFATEQSQSSPPSSTPSSAETTPDRSAAAPAPAVSTEKSAALNVPKLDVNDLKQMDAANIVEEAILISPRTPDSSPRLNRQCFSTLPTPNNSWRTPLTPNTQHRTRTVLTGQGRTEMTDENEGDSL